MNPYYRDYSDFLESLFPGVKMQKLSVNAGFTCPNRDGRIGYGGCVYCNNASFSPSYCDPSQNITSQLEDGKRFFGRKYPHMRYLAYFQSYTNTYGAEEYLCGLYRQAFEVDKVDGIIIGTRPDCVPDRLLDMLAGIDRNEARVIIELGAESSHNSTLAAINRGHTWECTADAVERIKARGIAVGLHFIMGLPGETTADMLATVDAVNALKPQCVKFHQLQLLRGTTLYSAMESGDVSLHLFTVEEYLDFCVGIVGRLDRDIAVERFVSQAPESLLVAPKWGLKNYQFTNLLHSRLAELQSNG